MMDDITHELDKSAELDQLHVAKYEKSTCTVGSSTNDNVTCTFKNAPSKKKYRRVFCLISMAFLYIAEGVNVSVIGPFFPIEAQKKGVSQTMVGVITSVTMIALWVFSILLLFVASEKNSRFIFYMGVFLSASMCILFGESIRIENLTVFMISCIIIRVIMGFGCACIWCTGAPILIPFFPKKAGKIFGLLEFCAGFGQMFGPPLGSLMFSVGGYRLPFWVAGLVEIFAGLLCVIVISVSRSGKNAEPKEVPHYEPPLVESGSVLKTGSVMSLNKNGGSNFSKSAINFITTPGILLITLPILSVMNEVGFFQVALAPYLLSTFQIDGNTSGNIFLIHAALSALTCAFYGLLVDRGMASKCIVICTLLTSVGFLILGLPFFVHGMENHVTLYVGLALLGVTANGGFIPGYFLFEKIGLKNKIDSQAKIRIYVCTWMNSCYAVGSILGQVFVGGLFYETFKFYLSCLLLSLFAFISTCVGYRYLQKAQLFQAVYYEVEQT